VLLAVSETLTRADHQTHRRYPFEVPADCSGLTIRVRYSPKYLSAEESRPLIEAAVASQAATVAPPLMEDWRRWYLALPADLRLGNLLTPSLDDARGAYRGAGHRHAPEQEWLLREAVTPPGLIPGPLLQGTWTLTITVHTLVSAACDLSIQIGAETASSDPSAVRRSA
jgi:hypothetical protein